MFSTTIIDTNKKAKASRLSFGEELAELGAQNENIVVLDADLSKSTRTDLFAAKFPNRFFEMGIAEANMIGVASGLAAAGKISFAASFGCFLTGRYDQIRMSIAAPNANVRLIGTHAGIAIGPDGHSQMALEDLALMRVLPGMSVFQPGDDTDTRNFMKWSLTHKGPCYMRLTRQDLPNLQRKSTVFATGKWEKLTENNGNGPIVLLASGGLVGPAIYAADILQKKTSQPIEIVNANWIKPIDEAMLESFAQRLPKLVVTLEDHYCDGGLGGAVAEWMAESGTGTKLLRIGVKKLGQSGTPEDNYSQYGFSPNAIAESILKKL